MDCTYVIFETLIGIFFEDLFRVDELYIKDGMHR